MQRAAETRQCAVKVTVSGAGPQEEKLVGVVVRPILPVLALAWRMIPVALGMHVKESGALLVPAVAGKVMVRGLVAQVALGVALAENPMAA